MPNINIHVANKNDAEHGSYRQNSDGNVFQEVGSTPFAAALLQLSFLNFIGASLNNLVVDDSNNLVITEQGLLVESP